MNSPPDTVLLFEDEFSLSNTATVSYQWAERGKQPKAVCKQRRRERQTVFGSYNFMTAQMVISFAYRGNQHTFKKHLKKVLRAYPKASKIIMVLDNVAFHRARKLRAWMAMHPRLELVFLPAYSPELNPIERAWWYMRKKITHNRYVHSLKERKAAFWKMFSHFLKPNAELLKVCEINF